MRIKFFYKPGLYTGLIIILLSGIIYAQADGPQYYPKTRTSALRVGDEDYQEKYLSLRGLPGVYVVLDYVFGSSKENNIYLWDSLESEVRRRLNEAGLKMYTKEEVLQVPGQPTIEIYATYPEHADGDDGGRYIVNPECCTASIWASFFQGGTTLRDPLTNYKISTWGEGASTHDCSNLGDWMSRVVLEKIDQFVGEYNKAKGAVAQHQQEQHNPAPLPAAEFPECNTAIMLHAELFATNSTKIKASKQSILVHLAKTMMKCPNYRYLVETHADQRASHEYNEMLSAKRAQAIAIFLISNGVTNDRFEVRSYGETRPLTTGTTEEDYAANRRVVVTPYKVK